MRLVQVKVIKGFSFGYAPFQPNTIRELEESKVKGLVERGYVEVIGQEQENAGVPQEPENMEEKHRKTKKKIVGPRAKKVVGPEETK
jgi:hypothetical protein